MSKVKDHSKRSSRSKSRRLDPLFVGEDVPSIVKRNEQKLLKRPSNLTMQMLASPPKSIGSMDGAKSSLCRLDTIDSAGQKRQEIDNSKKLLYQILEGNKASYCDTAVENSCNWLMYHTIMLLLEDDDDHAAVCSSSSGGTLMDRDVQVELVDQCVERLNLRAADLPTAVAATISLQEEPVTQSFEVITNAASQLDVVVERGEPADEAATNTTTNNDNGNMNHKPPRPKYKSSKSTPPRTPRSSHVRFELYGVDDDGDVMDDFPAMGAAVDLLNSGMRSFIVRRKTDQLAFLQFRRKPPGADSRTSGGVAAYASPVDKAIEYLHHLDQQLQHQYHNGGGAHSFGDDDDEFYCLSPTTTDGGFGSPKFSNLRISSTSNSDRNSDDVSGNENINDINNNSSNIRRPRGDAMVDGDDHRHTLTLSDAAVTEILSPIPQTRGLVVPEARPRCQSTTAVPVTSTTTSPMKLVTNSSANSSFVYNSSNGRSVAPTPTVPSSTAAAVTAKPVAFQFCVCRNNQFFNDERNVWHDVLAGCEGEKERYARVHDKYACSSAGTAAGTTVRSGASSAYTSGGESSDSNSVDSSGPVSRRSTPSPTACISTSCGYSDSDTDVSSCTKSTRGLSTCTTSTAGTDVLSQAHSPCDNCCNSNTINSIGGAGSDTLCSVPVVGIAGGLSPSTPPPVAVIATPETHGCYRRRSPDSPATDINAATWHDISSPATSGKHSQATSQVKPRVPVIGLGSTTDIACDGVVNWKEFSSGGTTPPLSPSPPLPAAPVEPVPARSQSIFASLRSFFD